MVCLCGKGFKSRSYTLKHLLFFGALNLFQAFPSYAGMSISTTSPNMHNSALHKEAATTRVKRTIQDALKGLKITKRQQRQNMFEDLVLTFFDIPRMSDYVIGKYAQALDATHRKDYESLMVQYTAALYLDKFDAYGKNLSMSHFTIGRAIPLQQSAANTIYLVKTQLLPEGYGAPVPLDWYLVKNAGAFYVLDIHIAGISFIRTKKEEFQAVLKSQGLQAFLTKIRTLLKEKNIAPRHFYPLKK